MNILTTHVGSLPRPKEVSDLLFKRENNQEYDQKHFDDVISNNVFEVVKKQLDIGIDIISDGEMSKISYATYVKDRYSGFAGDSERNPPQDLEKFPNYMKKIAASGGTPTYSRPCCVSEIIPKDSNDLLNDIDNLKNSSEINIPKNIYIVASNNLSKLQISFYSKLSDLTNVNIYLLSVSYTHLTLPTMS